MNNLKPSRFNLTCEFALCKIKASIKISIKTHQTRPEEISGIGEGGHGLLSQKFLRKKHNGSAGLVHEGVNQPR